jgi:hypothetical protein
MSWSRPFDDPIPTPKGKPLVTLKEAAAWRSPRKKRTLLNGKHLFWWKKPTGRTLARLLAADLSVGWLAWIICGNRTDLMQC